MLVSTKIVVVAVASSTEGTTKAGLHHPLMVLVEIRIISLALTNISSQNSFGKF